MKWTDPTIQLVSCGKNGWNDWDRVVLEGLARYIDFHSIHIYTGSSDYYSNVLAPHQAERAIDICQALIEQVRYTQRIEHPISIAYDEWNVWFRTHNDIHPPLPLPRVHARGGAGRVRRQRAASLQCEDGELHLAASRRGPRPVPGPRRYGHLRRGGARSRPRLREPQQRAADCDDYSACQYSSANGHQCVPGERAGRQRSQLLRATWRSAYPGVHVG